MRPSLLGLIALPLLVTTAAADRTGGGKGGGALSRVSAGISTATHVGGSNGGSSSYTGRPYSDDYHHARSCYDVWWRTVECRYGYGWGAEAGSAFAVRRAPRFHSAASDSTAKLHLYAGAQLVSDSDGSATLELAVTDWRLRINGTFTRYFERQDGGGVLQMSMPTLTGGLRIDDMGPTAVFVEAGVVHVRTSGDPMADSKLTGPIAGVRVEHALGKKLSLLGDVQQMWFDHDVRANAGRVGVRYGHVQASFRVLDFNVGPPLLGPEVGVRF